MTNLRGHWLWKMIQAGGKFRLTIVYRKLIAGPVCIITLCCFAFVYSICMIYNVLITLHFFLSNFMDVGNHFLILRKTFDCCILWVPSSLITFHRQVFPLQLPGTGILFVCSWAITLIKNKTSQHGACLKHLLHVYIFSLSHSFIYISFLFHSFI